MRRPVGLFILDSDALELVYGPSEYQQILDRVVLAGPAQTKRSIAQAMHLLSEVEVLFSGWGAPLVDDAFLDAATNLKAIFYAGGAVGSWSTDAIWDRGIIVTSANDANAIPVAEYALSTILFSLKHGWSLARRTSLEQTFPDRNQAPGAYRSTVGLVSLGMVGRHTAELLRPFELKVLAYDPFVSQAEAATLGVELVSLPKLLSLSDVVSIHTPSLPETSGMITGEHIASMKTGATLINTARGEIIREREMLAVLKSRPDLYAVLDTVVVEPPPRGSPLYSLPNIVLTPHIAGSVGMECRRMSRYMIEEFDRYLAGQPLKWQVNRHHLEHTVHRPQVKVRRPIVPVSPPTHV